MSVVSEFDPLSTQLEKEYKKRKNTILSLDRLIASWLRMNFVTKADLKTKPRVRGGPTKRSTSSSSTVSVGIGDASTSQINAISTPPKPSSSVATTVPLKQQQQQPLSIQPLSIQEKARIEREQRALLRDQTAATLKIQRRKKFFPHYTSLFCIKLHSFNVFVL